MHAQFPAELSQAQLREMGDQAVLFDSSQPILFDTTNLHDGTTVYLSGQDAETERRREILVSRSGGTFDVSQLAAARLGPVA